MFDCGEGTQRQMMRYGISFTLADIFVTHYHADHYLGISGLVRTLSLQGRTEPMRLHGPRGAQVVLRKVMEFGLERIAFDVDVVEVKPGDRIDRGEYEIVVFPAVHGRNAVGYAVVEGLRLGRFDPDQARLMGIPEGPLWGRLHRGEVGELPDGRKVGPEELVGPPRPGRKVVYTGDTRPSAEIVRVAENADLLIHDGTFGAEEGDRAAETDHSTAVEAAQIALSARAKKLVLNHLSARYSKDFYPLLEQAREVFPDTTVARDGMKLDVPYAD